ncbi:hypothetical protein ETAA8_60460 [Anatilimnocola aggregata]|uniref:Tetratricopeptide repeat protein n=1 Tax=Anatilimnocola aggregata TaxID=2528021 RepID=A0A517YKY6_9BACT|nr:hypothetical protein [Anatilimnocola aggregata]QDU30897.1 hypothetical protein ETAA8_60460 [Anatilimnocola aggregata]
MVLLVEAPNELAKWKYAAALEAREAGEKEKAYELLEQARQRSAHNLEYKQVLAEWKHEDREYAEALAIVQELCEIFTDNTDLIGFRSRLYQHLQRHPEAIADLQKIMQISEATGQPERALSLNNLAYGQAIAKTDLDAAFEHSNEAVKLAEADLASAANQLKRAQEKKKDVLESEAAVANKRFTVAGHLDTRGLVRLYRDEAADAQSDFDQAISLAEQTLKFSRAFEKEPRNQQRPKAGASLRQKQVDETLAVLYYHRSLNLQKLGREDEAKRDFAKAKELLGREPDETLF